MEFLIKAKRTVSSSLKEQHSQPIRLHTPHRKAKTRIYQRESLLLHFEMIDIDDSKNKDLLLTADSYLKVTVFMKKESLQAQNQTFTFLLQLNTAAHTDKLTPV